MVDPVRYHKIKAPDDKDAQILKLLQQEGVPQKVQGIAATLNDCFNAQTKILVDLNIGAEFEDQHDAQIYIYEGTIVPYDFDALTTLIMREAQHPVEELEDQGYAMFRSKQLASGGERFVCSLRDFIKMISIQRWKILDMNNGNKEDIIKNIDFRK